MGYVYFNGCTLVLDMGMEIGISVTVCELVEEGNAVKAGVRLGDKICQVSSA